MRLEPPARRISDVARVAQQALREVSNGRYRRVVRGAVNWANFPFDRYDWAAAVLVDHASLLRRWNKAAITLEMMTRMPENVDEIDDDLTDLMRNDALLVWERLASNQTSPREPGLPLVMKVDASNDMAMEVSDASLKIQGVVATVWVEV